MSLAHLLKSYKKACGDLCFLYLKYVLILIKHSKLTENTHPPTLMNPADLTGDLSQLFCNNSLAYCP